MNVIAVMKKTKSKFHLGLLAVWNWTWFDYVISAREAVAEPNKHPIVLTPDHRIAQHLSPSQSVSLKDLALSFANHSGCRSG